MFLIRTASCILRSQLPDPSFTDRPKFDFDQYGDASATKSVQDVVLLASGPIELMLPFYSSFDTSIFFGYCPYVDRPQTFGLYERFLAEFCIIQLPFDTIVCIE